MKFKKLLVSAIVGLSVFAGSVKVGSEIEAKNILSTEINKVADYNAGLKENQTTLFYMYSNNEGHYFLDPLAKYENVIFVGNNDYLVNKNLKVNAMNLHHGTRYVGTFEDETLWELVGIKEAI